MNSLIFAVLLFLTGIYCILTKRNLVKIILGITISETGLCLITSLIGNTGGDNKKIAEMISFVILLTGSAVTLIAIAISVRLYEKYGTLDVSEMKKLKG